MVVATLICSTSIVTAQTVEPSQTLTEIVKKKDCTVFTFYYPSVSAAGEETVLSSALFAWTPSDRQEAGGIESLHIYSHITVTADKERLTTTEGLSKEQTLLDFFPSRAYSDGEANYVTVVSLLPPTMKAMA